MKLLRQHTQATSSVPSTAPTASRWAAAPRAGSRPSGNSSTAQRYATPEARWKAKWTAMTTGSCASRWKASWLGALKVAAVPRQAMDTSRGTTSWGRRTASSTPSARFSRLNRYWVASPATSSAVIGAAEVSGGTSPRPSQSSSPAR